MKHILTLFFCFLIALAFAQTDSTSIKLDQYKSWHDKGMISDADYAALRAKVLGLQPQSVVKTTSPFADSSYRAYYRKKFNAEIISGGVCLPIGVGAAVTGTIVLLQVPNDQYPGSDEYTRFIQNRNTAAVVLLAAGGALTISGAVLLGLGVHQRDIYRKETVTLRASISPSGVGLSLAFSTRPNRLRL